MHGVEKSLDVKFIAFPLKKRREEFKSEKKIAVDLFIGRFDLNQYECENEKKMQTLKVESSMPIFAICSFYKGFCMHS